MARFGQLLASGSSIASAARKCQISYPTGKRWKARLAASLPVQRRGNRWSPIRTAALQPGGDPPFGGHLSKIKSALLSTYDSMFEKSRETLEKLDEAFDQRLQKCIRAGGGHFDATSIHEGRLCILSSCELQHDANIILEVSSTLRLKKQDASEPTTLFGLR